MININYEPPFKDIESGEEVSGRYVFRGYFYVTEEAAKSTDIMNTIKQDFCNKVDETISKLETSPDVPNNGGSNEG